MIERPRGMSQLDYLWVTYGPYSIATSLDDSNAILTTDLVTNGMIDLTNVYTKQEVDLKINLLIEDDNAIIENISKLEEVTENLSLNLEMIDTLVKDINKSLIILNGDIETEGSVLNSINNALSWVEIN